MHDADTDHAALEPGGMPSASSGVESAPDTAGQPLERDERLPQRPALPRLRNSKEVLRLQAYASLLVVDLACIAAAFTLANLLRFHAPGEPGGLVYIPLTSVVFGMLAFSGRAYSVEALENVRTSIGRALRALVLTAFTVVVIFFSLKTSAQFSRAVLAIGFALAIVLMSSCRYVLGKSLIRRFDGVFVREVLIIDGSPVAPRRGQIVLFADRSGISPSLNDPEAFGRLGALLANCDRILLACEKSRRFAWTEALRSAGTPVEVLTPELDDLHALSFRHSEGRACVLVAPGPLSFRSRLLKRGVDLTIAAASLVALAPVLIAAAIAIKLTSPGPVFFRQPRIGYANKQFNVLKFRSMRVSGTDTAGNQSASRDDQRITPVGGFLRRTSLDELPQLINVLLGDMSIVGPRPHALGSTAEEELFWDIDNRYWQRGAVKPGLTGLAQVRGFRGATDRREDLTNRLQADLEYLSNWSIWRDFWIMLSTFKVLVHPNAY